MVTPNLSTFEKMSRDYNIIPVFREISIDYDTPVSLFDKVAGGDYAFLLESLEGGERWGRYSFIGFRPFLLVKTRDSQVVLENRDGRHVYKAENPIDFLQRLMNQFRMAEIPGLPRFSGGAIGYFGYDMVRYVERLPENLRDETGFYDSVFIFPEVLLCVDNLKQSLKIIVNAVSNSKISLKDSHEKACSLIESVIRKVKRGIDYPEPDIGNLSHTRLEPEVSQERFKQMVERAKEYIRAGDVIQVVVSQRFAGRSQIPPFELYRAVRRINPSPYLYYLKLGDEVLVGSSPEILVRLTGEDIELRPIAGTRPRGRTEEEDRVLETELLNDPKEKAEHVMLVDLARNDAGRVAEMGSVKVADFMAIERYSHVMHIVSSVTARLKNDLDMFDVFKACFPAGTVSGAPKVRAMEIIEELEHARRGPYAGAVGYLGFSGSMDLAIAIRTLCQKGDMLYLQAGAGIVADSVPENEWLETLNKGRALMRAIEDVQTRS